MRRYRNAMIMSLSCVLLLGALGSCKSDDSKKEKKEKEDGGAVPVSVIVAAETVAENSVSIPATIVADKEIPISFSTAGTVKAVYVDVGDYVHKGQLVATVDATQLENSYEMAKAAEEQAADAHRRMQMLHDQKALAEIKWVAAQTQLKEAKTATAIAKHALGDARLVAQTSGTVTSRSVEPGQNVFPGQPVVNLSTSSNLEVSVSVAENLIGDIKPGAQALVVCNAADTSFTAMVKEIGVTADQITRSYTVKLTLPATSSRVLKPGMTCKVQFAHPEGDTKSVVVPYDAVGLNDDNSRYVWLCKGGKAVRRAVTVKDITDTGVAVSSGVAPGDTVIVSGQQKVSEGNPVKPINK